ncbi:MAG TPA: hypothetical protein VN861_16430 [Candidatus Acidoferrales bacterium]|nr:hypothetical protein [Candidatus Acidoferrales bacterium]
MALAASADEPRFPADRNRVAVGFWMQLLLPLREAHGFLGRTGGAALKRFAAAQRRGGSASAGRGDFDRWERHFDCQRFLLAGEMPSGHRTSSFFWVTPARPDAGDDVELPARGLTYGATAPGGRAELVAQMAEFAILPYQRAACF